jgi:hypothetical protein
MHTLLSKKVMEIKMKGDEKNDTHWK